MSLKLMHLSRSILVERLILFLGLLMLSVLPVFAIAHPTPNTIVLLDIKQKNVTAELQLPLTDLQLATGYDLSTNPEIAINKLKNELITYVTNHVKPVSEDNKPWQVSFVSLSINTTEQTATGPYQQLIVQLLLTPPEGANSRNFKFNYDVIIHQVVTHKAIVRIRQDWERGVHGEQTTDLGLIELDVVSNTIKPLIINQQPGSAWQGFKSMVNLGMNHIAEGTDHLLFLLTLLLPAPLSTSRKGWGTFGGTRYSIIRLLTIVTAFTIGHSITLIVGSLNWLRFPQQPIEILIACSIIVSAIHAIRPLFPGKEAVIAALFGLIHGSAFASTLVNLNLETCRMALSILGFNIGIELMQLFVILLIVPSFILLSKTKLYSFIRIGGAIIAGIAAIAWIIERVFQRSNFITNFVQQSSKFAPYLVVWFAVVAISSLFIKEKS
jgi:hypothetical protein